MIKEFSVQMKGKVYETVVRPAMLYGLETAALRKRQEMEEVEIQMLRSSEGTSEGQRMLDVLERKSERPD